jgi:hypothetical protein
MRLQLTDDLFFFREVNPQVGPDDFQVMIQCRGHCFTRLILCWLQYHIHGDDEVLPPDSLRGKLGMSFGRDMVVSSGPTVGQHLPFAQDQACPFQAMERRVQGAFLEFEVTLTPFLQLPDNVVTIHRLLCQQAEKQGIRVALDKLSFLYHNYLV